MRLGFMELSSNDLTRAVKFAQRNEFKTIEIAYVEKTWLKKPFVPEEEYDVEAVNSAFAGSGVAIGSVGLWLPNTMAADPEERKANHAKIIGLMDLAKATGAPLCLLGTGNYIDGDEEANVAEFKKIFALYSEEAKARDLKIAFYIGSAFGEGFVTTQAILDRLLEEIPELMIKFDPNSFIVKTQDVDPYAFLRKYAKRVPHVQAHEIIKEDGYFVEPAIGYGDVQWGKILGMLIMSGYQGDFIIEPHGPYSATQEKRFEHIMMSKRFLDQFYI